MEAEAAQNSGWRALGWGVYTPFTRPSEQPHEAGVVVVPSSQTELRLRELELPAEGHTAGDQPKPVSCPTPGCFSATAATWGDSVVVIILAHIDWAFPVSQAQVHQAWCTINVKVVF